MVLRHEMRGDEHKTEVEMSETSEAVKERRSTWALASMADCGSPEDRDAIGCVPEVNDLPEPSAGAKFLRRVEDAMTEADEYERFSDEDAGDVVHEIADGAASVYTAERWAEFVDLAAWGEDISAYGDAPDSLTHSAGIALYMIAERLCWAILEENGQD